MLVIIISIVIAILADVIYRNWKFNRDMNKIKREKEQYSMENYQENANTGRENSGSAHNESCRQENSVDPTALTRELMKRALVDIGCNPEDSEDVFVEVAFQGEKFQIEFGGCYARIWDPGWYSISKDDPEWDKVKEAINKANFNFGPTIIYTESPDGMQIFIHSRTDVILLPGMPDKALYVKSVLESFFFTKDSLRNSFREIISSQQSANKSQRPVGLYPDNPETLN